MDGWKERYNPDSKWIRIFFFISFYFIALQYIIIIGNGNDDGLCVCVCVIEIHALGNYRWRRWRLSSKMMMVEVVDGWLVGWIDDWSMVS